MKKHLLALAALATVSSAAFAQSATVYGFLDVGVFTSNNAGPDGKRLTTMENAGGTWFPSMFGITGSEDLGGGLKASFNLQGSLSVANGTTTDLDTAGLFGRYASVTLSGAAGSVEMGRQIDLLFLQSFVNGVIPTHANSLAVNGLLAYGSSSSANAHVSGSRIDNAITYRTPTINGIQGAVMYAPGGTAGSNKANALYTYLLTANVSGVALSAGYETQNDATTSNVYHKSLVGAKYTVGAVDLAGQVHNYKAKDSSINTNAYELGVAYHPTKAVTVGVNYEHFKNKADNTKPTITSLKAKYDLSKRTYLYGMAARYNADAAGEIYQGYAVGVIPAVVHSNDGTIGGLGTKSATNFAVGVVHGF